jgi:ElaA protein
VTDLVVATFADLDTTTLYALLKLRTDVFVVEQECAYPELDGRDTEPGTLHVWMRDDEAGPPLGYLRVLAEPDGGARIGRVCVSAAARGGGAADRLMRAAIDLAGPRHCVLDAQSYLLDFYGRYGFTPTGPEYIEDGIPHVPMARPACPARAGPGRAGPGRPAPAGGRGEAAYGMLATSSAIVRRRPV